MLNWLARYAPVGPLLLDDDGSARTSILDVGCGPHGLACAFPDVPFTGLEVEFPQRVAPTMTAFRAAPDGLPFADGAFGTVLCLDVLEHIPRPQRAPFVHELARVAAERVILACPSSEEEATDQMFAGLIRAQGQPQPYWLEEHQGLRLPTPDEIAAMVAAPAGFSAREIAMSNGLIATLAAVGDVLGPLAARSAAESREERENWVRLFAGSCFGTSGRKGWVIERAEPLVPIVPADADDLRIAALTAARCPSCDRHELAPVEDALAACAFCGRLVPLDATGAWDLAADQWAGQPAPAARRFLCEPAWQVEQVAAVLRAFADRPASANEALLLRAAPGRIRGEHALAVAQAALGGVALRPGQDVVIVQEPLTADQLDALAADCTVLDPSRAAAQLATA